MPLTICTRTGDLVSLIKQHFRQPYSKVKLKGLTLATCSINWIRPAHHSGLCPDSVQERVKSRTLAIGAEAAEGYYRPLLPSRYDTRLTPETQILAMRLCTTQSSRRRIPRPAIKFVPRSIPLPSFPTSSICATTSRGSLRASPVSHSARRQAEPTERCKMEKSSRDHTTFLSYLASTADIDSFHRKYLAVTRCHGCPSTINMLRDCDDAEYRRDPLRRVSRTPPGS